MNARDQFRQTIERVTGARAAADRHAAATAELQVLQTQLDAAHRRIAELDAQVRTLTTLPEGSSDGMALQ